MQNIRTSLLDDEIIEDYPENRRGHSCLILGRSKLLLHIVCAISQPTLGVVTVYFPEKDKWIDYRVRRK